MCEWSIDRLTSEKVAMMYYFGIVEKRFVRNLRMSKTFDNHVAIVKKNTNSGEMLKRCVQRTQDYKVQKWMKEHSNEWKALHNGRAQIV